MSKTILAKKGDLRKKFPLATWSLLKDKNGWEIIEPASQVIDDSIIKKAAPDNGEKKIVKTAKPQTVENTVALKEEEKNIVVNDSETIITESSIDPVNKEFADFVKTNISKSSIKNYLDEKNIPYKNNMSLNVLTGLLSVEFGGDLDKLTFAFGINDAEKSSGL